jgi:hypothetical protein
MKTWREYRGETTEQITRRKCARGKAKSSTGIRETQSLPKDDPSDLWSALKKRHVAIERKRLR